MVNKKIFITGGAGYLGRNIVKRYYDNNEITIYSRDEAKHYYLKKEQDTCFYFNHRLYLNTNKIDQNLMVFSIDGVGDLSSGEHNIAKKSFTLKSLF